MIKGKSTSLRVIDIKKNGCYTSQACNSSLLQLREILKDFKLKGVGLRNV